MRTMMLILLLAPLALAGVQLENKDLEFNWGVVTRAGTNIEVAENQTIEARVTDPSKLANVGLKGSRKGDRIQLTLISERERKVKLMHVPSGAEVTALVSWLQSQKK